MSKTKEKLTDKERAAIFRTSGAKGGRSRSPAKLAKSRKNVVKYALPGKAVWELKRDVETKIAENRRQWLLSNADQRISLDITFEKLVAILDQIDRKKLKKNGGHGGALRDRKGK